MIYQASIWFNPHTERELAEREVQAVLDNKADHEEVRLAKTEWFVLEQSDSRVPPPPKPYENSESKVLVGEARVIGKALYKASGKLTSNLEKKDLLRLREATRAGHKRAHPHDPPLTDGECDAIINDQGPETAAKIVRALH